MKTKETKEEITSTGCDNGNGKEKKDFLRLEVEEFTRRIQEKYPDSEVGIVVGIVVETKIGGDENHTNMESYQMSSFTGKAIQAGKAAAIVILKAPESMKDDAFQYGLLKNLIS